MRAAQPDRPTASSPPTKPRGARRWPYVAVVALPVVLYLGAYALARCTSRLAVYRWSRYDVESDSWGSPRDHVEPTNDCDDADLARLFRPCVDVEEWWRNR